MQVSTKGTLALQVLWLWCRPRKLGFLSPWQQLVASRHAYQYSPWQQAALHPSEMVHEIRGPTVSLLWLLEPSILQAVISVLSLPTLFLFFLLWTFTWIITFLFFSSQGASYFCFFLVLADDCTAVDATVLPLMLLPSCCQLKRPLVLGWMLKCPNNLLLQLKNRYLYQLLPTGLHQLKPLLLLQKLQQPSAWPLKETTSGLHGDGLQRPERAKGLLQGETVMAEAVPWRVRSSTCDHCVVSARHRRVLKVAAVGQKLVQLVDWLTVHLLKIKGESNKCQLGNQIAPFTPIFALLQKLAIRNMLH